MSKRLKMPSNDGVTSNKQHIRVSCHVAVTVLTKFKLQLATLPGTVVITVDCLCHILQPD